MPTKSKSLLFLFVLIVSFLPFFRKYTTERMEDCPLFQKCPETELSPTETVDLFHKHLHNQQDAKAWAMLHSSYKKERYENDYEVFKENSTTLRLLNIKKMELKKRSQNEAVVRVIESSITGANGIEISVAHEFEVILTLDSDNQWLIAEFRS